MRYDVYFDRFDAKVSDLVEHCGQHSRLEHAEAHVRELRTKYGHEGHAWLEEWRDDDLVDWDHVAMCDRIEAKHGSGGLDAYLDAIDE